MNNNYYILRVIIGAVLDFYGVKLLGMTLQNRPDNYILFIVIAIVFIAVGTIYAIYSIKNYMKQMKDNEVSDNRKGDDESCE